MPRRYLLLFMLAARSWACMCSGNWPSVKQAWKDAPAVFLGTVETADPDGDGSRMTFQEQLVIIRVDEAFKGVSAGEAIQLHQGASDCAAKFRSGQRAVFYLYKGINGAWVVRPCSHALGSAEPTGDDLLFLRGLPKSAAGTRLSGAVEYYRESPTKGFSRVAGIPRIEVRISGRQGFTRAVLTNEAGAFEVFGLPPGTYSVAVQVPSAMKMRFPVITGSPRVEGDDAAVRLEPDGGASVSFVLEDDTRLVGRMLDARGLPKTGVCLELEPVEGRGEDGARFFNCSKDGGRFEMNMMPPGKYWLVARDEVSWEHLKSKSTLYYPGVRDRELATIVSIEAGKSIEQLDIRLPSNEKRHRIAGRVQFSDGQPAANATVTFTSSQHGYSESAETGVDGTFGMAALAGMDGQLSVQFVIPEFILRSCPQIRVGPRRTGMLRFIDATPIPLSTNGDHERVTVELASASCNAWPPR